MHRMPHHHTIFQPLRHQGFRRLWYANLVSNLGSWGQTFAATWHVAALSNSLMLTSLVQTATWMPMLLFALPAGMLADTMPKPKLLLLSNAAISLTALALSLMTTRGSITPSMVLLFTFVTGTGTAFILPAWQTSMSELVEPKEVIAVSSLNNLSYNLAAFAGPLLGGIVYLAFGPAPLYFFNAASFCWLLWIYFQWPVHSLQSATRNREASGSLATALAAASHSHQFRRLLLVAAPVFCVATAFAALLPSLVREILPVQGAHLASAHAYGTRMAALGAGAILASVMLPWCRHLMAPRLLFTAALLVFGAMLVLLGTTRSSVGHYCLIVCGGIAWSAIVTSINTAALLAFPLRIRARTLSLYILVVATGQAIGGALWGRLAIAFGLMPTIIGAGFLMILCAGWVFFSRDFLEHQ